MGVSISKLATKLNSATTATSRLKRPSQSRSITLVPTSASGDVGGVGKRAAFGAPAMAGGGVKKGAAGRVGVEAFIG